MLSSLLNTSRLSASLARASPGFVVTVQDNGSKFFYSAQTPQAPDSKEESTTEASTHPFLAHLQQKTEKELFEILRKQQQQPTTEEDGEETPVSALLRTKHIAIRLSL